jgi:hypothetical protein
MSWVFPFLLALWGAGAVAHGAAGFTALSAVKLLPKEAAANLALIHAFEGKPTPERWHILVFDPKEESGVREFVLEDGEVVASRTVSQFAEELKASDVIGAETVKVDSDAAVSKGQKYAEVNRQKVAAFNYELRKDGEGAVPLWHVTCLDAKGESIGKLVMTATKGKVLSHDGFILEPSTEKEKTKPGSRVTEARPEGERPRPAARVADAGPPGERARPAPRGPEVRRAEAVVPGGAPLTPPQEERSGFLRRVFGGSR